MSADDVAKRAMELATRAEELARHAHERAGIDEQLAQLEAELAALDAEEVGIDTAEEAHRSTEEPAHDRPVFGWADRLTERVSSLGDRIGALVEGATEAATQSVEAAFGDDGEVLEERSVAVAVPGLVRIDSDGGSVRIVGHRETEVSVSARGRRGADQARFLEVTEHDGVVDISCRNRLRWWKRGVRLDVGVPVGSELRVRTGGGNVTATGVAGAAELKTGGGSIRLRGAKGDTRLLTGGGSIDVEDFDGMLDAGTGGGSIHIDGRLRGRSAVRTGGGSVTVRLAEGTSIRVEATGTGAFTDVDGLQAARGRITGQVGAGSDGELRASTGGGSIRVVR